VLGAINAASTVAVAASDAPTRPGTTQRADGGSADSHVAAAGAALAEAGTVTAQTAGTDNAAVGAHGAQPPGAAGSWNDDVSVAWNYEDSDASPEASVPDARGSALVATIPALDVAVLELRLNDLLGRIGSVRESVVDVLFRGEFFNPWLLALVAGASCELARRQVRQAPTRVRTSAGPEFPSSHSGPDNA
jgi:hypothetical protein